MVEVLTVDRVADRLRERVAIESYRENCESMQRVYMLPAIGTRKVAAVTTEDDERLASRMLASVEALLGTTARAAATSSSRLRCIRAQRMPERARPTRLAGRREHVRLRAHRRLRPL